MKKRNTPMQIINNVLIAFALTLLCFAVSAQTPIYTTYIPSTDTYSQDNQLMSIQFDKTANLVWAGTRSYHSPLKKFDGTNWTNYIDSVSNCVYGEASSVVMDNAHNVWYSTMGGGISKFNGTSFTNYRSSNSGLANDFVTCMAMDNSNNLFLYATNMHETQKFTGSVWSTLENFSYGLKMCYDSTNNTVWMATDGRGLKKIQGSVITTYNIGNSSIPNDHVTAITVDNNGAVWMAFDDNTSGIMKFNGTVWTPYTSGNSGLLNNNYIGTLKSDKNGNIWIGGGGYQGLSKFNGTAWTSYDVSYPYFPSMYISDIAFGNNNVLWIATGSGLVKMQMPTGISETIYDNNIVKLYPNPSSSQVTISFTKEFVNAALKITDVLGKEVKEINFTGKQITFNRENLENGTYFYNIVSENKKIAEGKLLIQ